MVKNCRQSCLDTFKRTASPTCVRKAMSTLRHSSVYAIRIVWRGNGTRLFSMLETMMLHHSHHQVLAKDVTQPLRVCHVMENWKAFGVCAQNLALQFGNQFPFLPAHFSVLNG